MRGHEAWLDAFVRGSERIALIDSTLA